MSSSTQSNAPVSSGNDSMVTVPLSQWTLQNQQAGDSMSALFTDGTRSSTHASHTRRTQHGVRRGRRSMASNSWLQFAQEIEMVGIGASGRASTAPCRNRENQVNATGTHKGYVSRRPQHDRRVTRQAGNARSLSLMCMRWKHHSVRVETACTDKWLLPHDNGSSWKTWIRRSYPPPVPIAARG